MFRVLSGAVVALIVGSALAMLHQADAQQPVAMRMAAPELKGIDLWINSKPIALSDLKGKVVVLHFWTFG
jgi:hypothetical protein